MDPISPLPPDAEPEPSPEPADPPTPPSSPASPTRAERRLIAKIGPDEHLVAWGRAWVSRETRLHTLLAARTLDFVVLTDDHLFVFSTGFFSRRPRRRVYYVPLDRLFVEDRKVPRGRRLAVWTRGRRPLLFELNDLGRNKRVADRIVERVRMTEAEMSLPAAPPRAADDESEPE